MMYENDKLVIPEKYREMSVTELRNEKEKIYIQIKKENSAETQSTPTQNKNIIFHF